MLRSRIALRLHDMSITLIVLPSLELSDGSRLTENVLQLSVEIVYLTWLILRGVFRLRFVAGRVAVNVQLSLALLLV